MLTWSGWIAVHPCEGVRQEVVRIPCQCCTCHTPFAACYCCMFLDNCTMCQDVSHPQFHQVQSSWGLKCTGRRNRVKPWPLPSMYVGIPRITTSTMPVGAPIANIQTLGFEDGSQVVHDRCTDFQCFLASYIQEQKSYHYPQRDVRRCAVHSLSICDPAWKMVAVGMQRHAHRPPCMAYTAAI
jgi:hypothetical protein